MKLLRDVLICICLFSFELITKQNILIVLKYFSYIFNFYIYYFMFFFLITVMRIAGICFIYLFQH